MTVPLYEYQCKKCKHKFEKIQKFSDRLIRKCPECGGPVEQTITAPAVQFKGSGFYATDYAAKTGNRDNGDGSPQKEDKTHEAKEATEKADKSGDKAKDKIDDKARKSTGKKPEK